MKRVPSLIYFFINTFGAILIFYFGYQIAALAKLEERTYYDGVDSITFFTQAFPVLAVCFLANVLWFFNAIFEAVKYRSYYSFTWFGAVTVLWVISFLAIRIIS